MWTIVPARGRDNLQIELRRPQGRSKTQKPRTNPASPGRRGSQSCPRPHAADAARSRMRGAAAVNAGMQGSFTASQPMTGMWNPGAALPSSGQRAVITLVRV